MATALGATSIERHITLDRAMYGSDQSASIEAKNLKSLSYVVKNVKNILGDGIKKLLTMKLKQELNFG